MIRLVAAALTAALLLAVTPAAPSDSALRASLQRDLNDYLAARDAEEMGPLYRFLGLTVGVVVQGRTRPERRAAYACSITYCSNKELAFDYLRDRVALARRASRLHLSLERLRGDASREEDLVLRGLHFAIVDEADSVFIDEARTPLILSATSRSAAAHRSIPACRRSSSPTRSPRGMSWSIPRPTRTPSAGRRRGAWCSSPAIRSSVVSRRGIDAASTPHISAQRRTVSRPGESA